MTKIVLLLLLYFTMSAILSADDLNDFILPGLACVKPVQELPSIPEPSDDVEIEVDMEGNTVEILTKDGTRNELGAAQISLADCLACLGCVTSAEEVLVAQHSYQEVLNALESQRGNAIFVASICHQTRASLAAAYGRTIDQVDYALLDLFVNQMGFRHVVGTGLGRKISLFNEAATTAHMRQQGTILGPVLSSICPGWVLYAEKTHPYVLSNLSKVKLAQQITGCILKTLTAKGASVSPDKVYHLSVMPCFDKKLESARKEALGEGAADVDCVLTAKELVSLVEEKYTWRWSHDGQQADLPSLNELYHEVAPQNWPEPSLSWMNDVGSASGGYAENYLTTYERKLKEADPSVIYSRKFLAGKNADLLEMRLVRDDTQEVMAKAAIVNGFRNIQNLVRKLKDGGDKKKVNPLVARRRARKSAAASNGGSNATDPTQELADPFLCDYVEIMACPGGCINGGGQIASAENYTTKEWAEATVAKYVLIPPVAPKFNLEEWTLRFCIESNIPRERLLETWFKAVEQPTDPNAVLFGAKW